MPPSKRARVTTRSVTVEIKGSRRETLDVSHDEESETLRAWLQRHNIRGIDGALHVYHARDESSTVNVDAPMSALGLFTDLQKDVVLVVATESATSAGYSASSTGEHPSFGDSAKTVLLKELEKEAWFKYVTSGEGVIARDEAVATAISKHPDSLDAQATWVREKVRGNPSAWKVFIDGAENGEIPSLVVGEHLLVTIRCVDRLGLSAIVSDTVTIRIHIAPEGNAISGGFEFELQLDSAERRDGSDRCHDDPDVDTSTLQWRGVPLFFFPRKQCVSSPLCARIPDAAPRLTLRAHACVTGPKLGSPTTCWSCITREPPGW